MNISNESNILIIAPHPDDEILGLGGTIKKFSSSGHKITILIVSGIALTESTTLIWRMEQYPATIKWIPYRLIAFFYIFFIFPIFQHVII